MEAELKLLFEISKVVKFNTVMGWIFYYHLAGSFSFCTSVSKWWWLFESVNACLIVGFCLFSE